MWTAGEVPSLIQSFRLEALGVLGAPAAQAALSPPSGVIKIFWPVHLGHRLPFFELSSINGDVIEGAWRQTGGIPKRGDGKGHDIHCVFPQNRLKNLPQGQGDRRPAATAPSLRAVTLMPFTPVPVSMVTGGGGRTIVLVCQSQRINLASATTTVTVVLVRFVGCRGVAGDLLRQGCSREVWRRGILRF